MDREEIYQHLKKQIIRFELQPGDFLSENALASELGVSRSPIRDALSQMEDEGYVRVYPQRGTQVTLIDLDRIHQLMFSRMVLDTQVLSQLCEQPLTEEQYQQLQESIKIQRRHHEKQSNDALLEEDMRMHRLFYQYSGHPSSWETFQLLDCDMQRVSFLQINSYSRQTVLSPVDSWEHAIVEHRMIIDALHKRDKEAVCLLNNRHIEQFLWSSEYLARIFPKYFVQS